MELLEKVWPEWKVEGVLGEGSFGKVYKIKREDIGGTYYAALKVISIPKDKSEVQSIMTEGMMDQASATHYFQGMVEEIVKEFAMMEKLKGNTNIVAYEDHKVIPHEDSLGWDILIRMELLTPLTDYMAEHTLGEQDALKLGIDICRGLELCQKHHIIHRDIKPENIFVSEMGDYKLGDFGVARTAEKTMSGMSKKGTYTYMAPEVYKGEAYNATVDLYSLGIVLYRLLNNYRTPFLPPAPQMISFSDKETAQARRMNGEELPAPAQGSEAFAAIIRKACAYNPKDRYADATQMRLALEALQGGVSGAATVAAAERMQSDRTDTVSKAAPAPVAEQFVTPGEKEDGTVAMAGNSVLQEDKTVSMYGNSMPQEDKTVSMQSLKSVEEPVKTEKSAAPNKKKTGLFVGIGVAAVALVACIILVIVKPFGGSGNAGNDKIAQGDGQADSAGGDVVYEDVEEMNILATKVATDAEGNSYVPEGAEAMPHNNRVYHPISMIGQWVAEEELDDTPYGSRMVLGEGENTIELDCLPTRLSLQGIYENENYSLDIEDANIGGMYYAGVEYLTNPSDENKISSTIYLTGVFDTHEDTLALGFPVSKESESVLNIEEIHYAISWTGWKLTLTYGEYSRTYVPYVFSQEHTDDPTNEELYTGGGCVYGYTVIDGLGDSLSGFISPNKAKDLNMQYFNPQFIGRTATVTCNEDGTMTIDMTEIEYHNYSYPAQHITVDFRASETALTLISDNTVTVYSDKCDTYSDWIESMTGEFGENITEEQVVQLVDNKTTILQRLKEAFAAAGIEVDIDEKTGKVSLDSSILFGFDDASLSQEGKDFLDRFLGVYASVVLSEECAGFVSGIEIEGHTDTSGKYDYNLKLSQERADSVANYCLTESNSGLSPEQLAAFSAMTTTVGRSYDQPIYNSDGTVNMDASRRVVFRFRLSTDV